MPRKIKRTYSPNSASDKTAIFVGTAATYKLLDPVNARLYLRAVDSELRTTEELRELIKSCFFRNPDKPTSSIRRGEGLQQGKRVGVLVQPRKDPSEYWFYRGKVNHKR